MNCVDAVCLKCGQPFTWLPGSPRVCSNCPPDNADSEQPEAQPKVKVKTS